MPEISLIPKNYKKGLSFETIFSKAGIFVLAVLIIGVLAYGGLLIYNGSVSKQIKETQAKIEELNKQRDVDFEEETKKLDGALVGLRRILSGHLYWSNIFAVIEKRAVPGVVFSDFSGMINADTFITLSFSGEASGYTLLAKQLVSFGEEKKISSIDLSGISIGSQGGIDFSLTISFEKEILLK